MGKEHEPTIALVDEKATIIVVCHQCGVLYSATERNFITTTAAETTAWNHGNSFSFGHHVSVLSGESPTSLEETLAVNEKPKPKPKSSSRKPFFIPQK